MKKSKIEYKLIIVAVPFTVNVILTDTLIAIVTVTTTVNVIYANIFSPVQLPG